jgi:hypothetical protein
MGNPLFGVNISKLIKDNIGPGVLDATLAKSTPGTRTPGNLTGGTQPTEVSYPCKGFIDVTKDRFMGGTIVRAGSRIVVLIGDTIDGGTATSAPTPGDRITIEGTVWQIPADGVVMRDPAAAVYECEVRAL